MKIKKGVNIQGLDIRMRPVLTQAAYIWNLQGQELVVTAGLDGEHSANSLHYYGLAVDLRTRDFTKAEKEEVTAELKKVLGCNYDVVFHLSHIHVEYDPK